MDNVVLYDRNDHHVVTLTLNRPEKANAFDDLLLQQFLVHLKKIASDPTIQLLILRGAGKNFSAGADLQWMQRMVNYSFAENKADAELLSEVMHQLFHCPIPTIAIAHGKIVGGGVGLIACCDIAIGSAETQFCLSEVTLGLAPAVISPYVIKAIGERNARRYFLTAEWFTAEHAKHMGLLHEVVDSSEALAEKTKNLSQLILANGPQAVRAAKALISRIGNTFYDEKQRQINAEVIATLRVSDEGQKRLQAFLQKQSSVLDK